ncbi:MAG: hydrogenase maturation peptidase HycI [Candidatus Bathyarchaeota archaeon]
MAFLEVENQLKSWLSSVKKLVFLGVGNPLRRDDGFGPALIKAISKYKLPDKVKLVNCETVPENFLNAIVRLKPSHVIVVDSAQMNSPPGEIKLFPPEDIGGIVFSTHTLPLTFTIKYIQRFTRAEVRLLLVQPENLDFGEGLTLKVEEALNNVKKILIKILQQMN